MVRRPQHQSLLVPLGEEEAAEETAFKVIYILHYKIKLHAFVFSSSTGQWRPAASKAWSDLLITSHEFDFMSRLRPFFLRHHYAYGCVYWDWLVINVRKLLVLDTTSMEFSMADLPPGDWSTLGLAIAEAGDGRLGMFGFRVGTASDLSYNIARNKGKSPSHWQMEKRISLDHGYVYDIKGATERHLLLRRTETSSDNPLNEYFSMDIDTLQLQIVSVKRYRLMYGTHIYTNFPPSLLSSPTI
uniref:Uncharacterized protein n=1 Tax=Avena sativa TaxID=4498 RepID=A0ACD6AJP9_AVESA